MGNYDDNQMAFMQGWDMGELGVGVAVLQYGIPVLWGLTIILLWRLSLDSERGGFVYQCVIGGSLVVSAVFYTFSHLQTGDAGAMVFLILSLLVSGCSIYSVLLRYREEHVL